jgi:hypothetical protein
LTSNIFFIKSIDVDLMEKGELQRMCVELFNQFEDFKNSSIDHLQRLRNFEIEKDVFIEKVKSLEDALMNSKLPLEKTFDYSLSIDSVASVSHAMPAHRTMFVKPSMSQDHTHSTCGDKGKNIKGTRCKNFNSIPTCHHYGISGHIRLNCFQTRSQKPWDKLHVPRKDKPGVENQVKNLSDQLKHISEKIGSLTPNEKKKNLSWLKKRKNTSNKQV